MIQEYSKLRPALDLRKTKGFAPDAARLSHYWRSIGRPEESFFRKAEDEAFGQIEFDVPFPPHSDPAFTFIDLFAGIGGFHLALHSVGGRCVFSSEWDRFAQQTYEANFGEVPFGDITKIEAAAIPDHDILCAGFPCQPFSIAGVSKKNALGRQHGFLDKTQGTLFFDVARIIDEKRPKAFILENVKNLRSHDRGNTFKVIENTLKELGYNVFSKVLDAAAHVPQHRERIFIVGFDQHQYADPQFSFPSTEQDSPAFRSILDNFVPNKYTLTDHLWNYLQDYAAKHRARGNGFGFGMTSMNGISRTLSARYYKDGSEILIPQANGKNPRRLTPAECKRLMGYPKEFLIEGIGVSDTQLYKQFGNSVVVPLVRSVAAEVVEVMGLASSKNKVKTQEAELSGR